MRTLSLGVSDEERKFIEEGKTVLIRPDNEILKNVQKGDKLKIDGIELLVLDIRDYPRLEDLLKIEPLEWIVCEDCDISDALRFFSEKFKTEKQGGKMFFAIEIAKQSKLNPKY